jgi:putative transposase
VNQPTAKVVAFPLESTEDVLTTVLRHRARQMLATAIEAEVQVYLAARTEAVDPAGHRQVVRNGYLPSRTLQTPLGDVPVRQPRVRDRRPVEMREIFRSAILPPYLRKTKSLEDLLPWLDLKGISTGDFSEALAALLGPDAPGVSASTITRLKTVWEQEYATWQGRQ